MKKAIIIRASGNELANQLWNYISIYAYCLEHDYKLDNPSFYEYARFFGMPTTNALIGRLFLLPFKNDIGRKFSFKKRAWKKIYKGYSAIVEYIHRNAIIHSDARTSNKTDTDKKHAVYRLPPAAQPDEQLATLERRAVDIYFDGWLFRNSAGIQKYHAQIKEYFAPNEEITQSVKKYVAEMRNNYRHLVGLHIRQGDYTSWKNGMYFMEQERVRQIAEEYLVFSGKSKNDICFVIASDGPIKKELFAGLNTAITGKNMVEDLFILSSMDVVIGSDSTFGAFASYYGNIPHIIMKKEAMDWNYYQDKKTFFENRYSTWVFFS